MHRLVNRVRPVMHRLFGLARRLSRYDLVLAAIPAAFVAAGALCATLSVAPSTVVPVAAVVSALAVADALFLNPPPDPSTGRPRA